MTGFHQLWDPCVLPTGRPGYMLKNTYDEVDITLVPVYDQTRQHIVSAQLRITSNNRATTLYTAPLRLPSDSNLTDNDAILKALSQKAIMDASMYFQAQAEKYRKLSDHYYEAYGQALTGYCATQY